MVDSHRFTSSPIWRACEACMAVDPLLPSCKAWSKISLAGFSHLAIELVSTKSKYESSFKLSNTCAVTHKGYSMTINVFRMWYTSPTRSSELLTTPSVIFRDLSSFSVLNTSENTSYPSALVNLFQIVSNRTGNFSSRSARGWLVARVSIVVSVLHTSFWSPSSNKCRPHHLQGNQCLCKGHTMSKVTAARTSCHQIRGVRPWLSP